MFCGGDTACFEEDCPYCGDDTTEEKSAEIKDKFIVIAIKDIKKNGKNVLMQSSVKVLIDALGNYNDIVELIQGEGAGKEFYVCNQDEDYAKEVIDIILTGEDTKKRIKAVTK